MIWEAQVRTSEFTRALHGIFGSDRQNSLLLPSPTQMSLNNPVLYVLVKMADTSID